MVRRDRWDIIYDVLSVARDGAGVTELIYRTNTSYSQIKEIIEQCGKMMHPSIEYGSTVYKTTPDGYKFIEGMDEIRKLLPKDFGENLKY